ncbi:MAG TPA: APC family permease [Xanthomonadaceae bacterium]|nr:APC family permease [Xanthomonadaceae bacterium]
MNDAHAPSTLRGEAALLRAVGAFALTAAVINVIVGAGVFQMPGVLAARMGAAAPLALVAGALAIIPIALCFAAVGSRVVATGGPYSYVTATFGPFLGFLAGALMWISNVTSNAGVGAALAGQAANLWPALAAPLPRAGFLTVVALALFALNAFGVKLGARAIATLAGLKLAPLVALAAAGVFLVDWSLVSFSPAAVPSWSAMGASMVLVMFAYSGMETALVPSGEVQDPSRSVPRAALVAIVLVVLLYLGVQIATQGLLGPAAAGASQVPLAEAAGRVWAPGGTLLLLTACVSMTGFLLGNLLGSSRLLFALGRDGYLPRAFAGVSVKHRVPLLALAVHAGLGWLMALLGNFDQLALISGGAICLTYVLVSLAAWRAQRRGVQERGAPFVLPGGPLVPLLAIAAMGLIVTTLSGREWAAIAIALAVLGVVYAALRTRARSRG